MYKHAKPPAKRLLLLKLCMMSPVNFTITFLMTLKELLRELTGHYFCWYYIKFSLVKITLTISMNVHRRFSFQTLKND